MTRMTCLVVSNMSITYTTHVYLFKISSFKHIIFILYETLVFNKFVIIISTIADFYETWGYNPYLNIYSDIYGGTNKFNSGKRLLSIIIIKNEIRLFCRQYLRLISRDACLSLSIIHKVAKVARSAQRRDNPPIALLSLIQPPHCTRTMKEIIEHT